MLEHERRLWNGGTSRLAGVDEAGRGPLAGPVYAAAVYAPPDLCAALFDGPWRLLNDSKKLTDQARRTFCAAILDHPDVATGIGSCTAAEIDTLNILRASHLAMARAVAALPVTPEWLLVDGLPVKGLPVPHTAVVGGDGKSLLIAAASVVAKVTRDDAMIALAASFPGYGFQRHKGYGTRQHREALARLGPCPEHRRSFAPIRQGLLDFPRHEPPS